MNLLEETRDDIELSGHTPEDIVFIGSRTSGHSCTWDEFCLLADAEYNNGFGAQEVASDLEIAFSDGATMWRRHEYDGSEHWTYSPPFVAPAEQVPIRALIGQHWPTLADLADPTDEHHNRSDVPTLNAAPR